MLEVYNTLTRKNEVFKPKSIENVKVYFCGPTVYNYAHIWNLKTFVVEDIIIKSLKFLWYKVNTVMNITDVDDKTIRESVKAGEPLATFTQKYTDIFLNDLKKLWVTRADKVVPVTTLIPEMIAMIQKMIDRKYAYVSEDGSVYFDISKAKNYWVLANLDVKGMKSSVRINNDEYEKDNVSDFVLWKAYKEEDKDNYWEADFLVEWVNKILKGRPGWHIECSACNLKYLGTEIDIHMGGIDLIFPHHQNEIAQSEAVTGKKFSRYWLHSGHITVDGKKMSKSLNNFYTLDDLEKKYKDVTVNVLHRAIRLTFIAGKYTDSIDFSFSKLESNITIIKKFDELLKRIGLFIETDDKNAVRKEFSHELQAFIVDYLDVLEDDFNIPEVLVILFELVTFINTVLDEKNITKGEARAVIEMLKTFNEVIGLMDFSLLEKNEVPAEILKKLEMRNVAKNDKNFMLADALRDELLALGYKIVDSREGTRVEKI